MYRLLILAMFALPAVPALGQVVSYEGTAFPEANGWTRTSYCTPQRWLDGGWFFQFVEEDASACGAGDQGDRDTYERTLSAFEGVDRFFVEWRVEATGPNTEIQGVGPASMVAWGLGGVNYRFTVSRDLVRVIRDNLLPFVWIEIAPGVAHTYRIDLDNTAPDPLYALYADGILADQGIAEGVYPFFSPAITWQSRVYDFDSQSRWDFVRYGRTPDVASADFNSDGEVNKFELFYIEECIQRSFDGEPAAPSCAWADVTGADNSVTCDDWQIIAETMWTGPGDPPELPACVVAPIPAVSDWGVGILALLMVTVATFIYGCSRGHRRSPGRAG